MHRSIGNAGIHWAIYLFFADLFHLILVFKVVTESPAWLVVFCILAGLALSFLLYRGSTGLKPWLRWLLIPVRFLVIALLSFLLLTPLIKTTKRQTEKPI